MGARTARVLDRVHEHDVFGRRIDVLCGHLCELLPEGASVLDVGCGDGSLAQLILERRPDLSLRGIDVLLRPQAQIPVERFDGRRLPAPDASVDVVMFVDVLHHTDDPRVLLAEAARVARRGVVVKDHTADGWLAQRTLRFMDDVGNARHGVALPYNYWPRRRWDEALAELGLRARHWRDRLHLYPWPASWVFDRRLHFVALFERT